MATQVIEKYLPKTAFYINNTFDTDGRTRGVHHNYVIEQKIINLSTPISEQSTANVKKIDAEMIQYLEDIDTPISRK